MTEPTDAELRALLPTKLLERDMPPKVQVWLTQKDALAFARAVLAKWGTPPAVEVEPVALLVRKNSWRDGQWEAAPPNSPSYGRAWANQRVYVYPTPQPAQAQAGAVPVGFRLVPIEPTVEILQAMDRAFSDAMHVGVPVSPEAYAAMIKAVDAADIKGADHGITAHGAARKQGGPT